MGLAAERSGSSGSSSGMDREGGGWRAAGVDDSEERRGSDGSEERESPELKRDALSPDSVMERVLPARGRRGEGGLRMPGPGLSSWLSSGPRERADDLRLRVEAPVV